MTFVPTPRRVWGKLRLAGGLFAAATLALPCAAAAQSEAGWLGLVEGAATVERAGVPEAAVAELPLVVGDRLITSRGARVEAVLAEGASLLVGADSEVAFAELVGSSDAAQPRNLLLLERGELLLAGEGAEETRVDTDNATVYLGAGSCRIERSEGATLVVARDGDVELRTRHGVVWLAGGRQAWVDGDEVATVEPAGDTDALERWAATLHGRRDLLAFEDDSGVDLASYDFAFDYWDIGEPVCTDHHHQPGRAVRTRPPHDEPDPGSTGHGPSRTVASNGGDTGAAVAEIEVPVVKPWPLADAGTGELDEAPIAKPILDTNDDPWRAASVAGTYAAAAESPAKEPQTQTASSSDDSGGGSSDTSSGDTSTFVAESAPSSPEPAAAPSPAPAPDSGSSDTPAFEAPVHDEPATEPNC